MSRRRAFGGEPHRKLLYDNFTRFPHTRDTAERGVVAELCMTVEAPEGGCLGEWAIRWYEFSTTRERGELPSARLEIYCDGWHAFRETRMAKLLDTIQEEHARRGGKDGEWPDMATMIRCFTAVGWKDVTHGD